MPDDFDQLDSVLEHVAFATPDFIQKMVDYGVPEQLARYNHAYYSALMVEGFSEEQAMRIVEKAPPPSAK